LSPRRATPSLADVKFDSREAAQEFKSSAAFTART
jgi:hypothetical protein